MQTTFQPGSLVKFHQRDWVVLPCDDEEMILLKPLGGTDCELKGVFRELAHEMKEVQKSHFPLPEIEDLGDFSSAQLLHDAARLSFRDGAGPFRSMGKLSFRPRSYQLVPLIMALKLDTVRLLIADDVGIGKTVEALLIVKEMLDRGKIKNFAVICLPHLCDQWKKELWEKFGIEAEIIRSGTVKKLERQLYTDETLFQHFPFQIISIDYIKGEKKRNVFLNHVPDMVVVDEAHTCSHPIGIKSSQQQRHQLLKAIADNPKQHLLLLTATPHSGKPEEFQSILGLIKPEFGEQDLIKASDKQKKIVAKHFVQRRRKNVEKWMDEKTPFPLRNTPEQSYTLSEAYSEVYEDTLELARKLATGNGEAGNNHLRYYLAIGLLRGVMSSPAAGLSMLHNKLSKDSIEQKETGNYSNSALFDEEESGTEDLAPTDLADQSGLKSTEVKRIRELAQKVKQLIGLQKDTKAKAVFDLLEKGLKTDNTIVFCRYIQTANYLGEVLEKALGNVFGKDLVVEVITSALTDEERKNKVDEIGKDSRSKKLIIATDCMSEGINLQEHFSALIHYDLPWNPNRLEQREGRIDRFGQPKPEVNALFLYGEDNPMDGTVLKVLLRKARNIRKAIGISVPFPDDSKSIMDAVLKSVLLDSKKEEKKTGQLTIGMGAEDVIMNAEEKVTRSFDRIEEREQQITSIFAQEGIKPDGVAPYLSATDEVLGNGFTVERFLRRVLPLFQCNIRKIKKGFEIEALNLQSDLKPFLNSKGKVKVAFDFPVPQGYQFIGRTHALVENLSLKILEAAFSPQKELPISRAAAFRSKNVKKRTTLYLLRIRNVIADQSGRKELVAEEMKLWGFTELPETIDENTQFLDNPALLDEIVPTGQLREEVKQSQLMYALEDYTKLFEQLNKLAGDQAAKMVKGHEQFRKAIEGDKYKVVEPVLPPDVLGIYVILPEKN